MLQRFSIRSKLAAAVAAGLVGAATLVWAAPADDFKEAQKLYSQGRVQPALDKVEAVLKAQPKDPQARFLKGILLTELNRTADAVQVFTALSEDFPELPEPYNNLAVLYAKQGNYDKAKTALELAIKTHPSYATAHENLGDVYAQLASRAYDRALQLDKNNTAAQNKLALVKELFSAGRTGSQRPDPAKAAAARAELAKADVPAPKAVEPPKVAAAPAGTPPPAVATVPPAPAVAPPKAGAPSPAPAKVEPTKAGAPATAAAPAATDDKARIAAAIEAWAAAWSGKDVKGYLASYAPEFDPEKPGQSRAAWEKERTERIERPKTIEVSAKVQSITVNGNEATAVIRQSYKSDVVKPSSATKTLKLVRSGDRWLIKQERLGG